MVPCADSEGSMGWGGVRDAQEGVCVCVCVNRESERERVRARERARERVRESE